MKFTSAIFLIAVLAAFLAMMTAAEESSENMGGAHSDRGGCPDADKCTKYCQKQGISVGKCAKPVNACVCIL
uniref:Defensin-like protein n=1 Tax=Dermacentor silvarum TaxID=543639 RepID=A0A6M3RHV4_DERSI|nr:defensin-like protein [Dermacentor silvarum]